MTDAYHEAEGVGHSRELTLLRLVERFGAPSVLGRPLYAREIIRMNAAENVYKAKYTSEHSDNWAEWARENKHAAELLAKVTKLAEDE